MRNRRATALILDTFDLQERDRIVTLLTAEDGKKRGVARGARAKYSRFAGQLQPLAKVEISWFERDGRDLVRISEVALVRSASALQQDLEGILLGAYLADHMKAFAQEDEGVPALFRLLDSTVAALVEGCDRHLAARYFEVWMLRLAGIFPVPEACPLCGRAFGARALLVDTDAVLACDACAGRGGAAGGTPFEVPSAVLAFLRRTGSEGLAALASSAPGERVLNHVEALCGRIRRAFLQHEIKSYEVMKRTLGSI